MQNFFASFVLVAWPLFAIYLFSTQSLSSAILWTIMGAQMALPVGASFKFEMIPQFDKNSIPNLSILIGCMIVAKRPLRIIGRHGLTEFLIIIFLTSPIITSQLNGDPITIGDRFLPGVGLYDAFSSAENAFIFMIPFFVGRQFLRSAEDIKKILYVLAVAGLVYSVPMIFEVRMSPNLQFWIYGFAPTSFAMTARGGGYRPMVFMGHGLIASFFAMTTAVAATALWRTRVRVYRVPPAGLTAYLSGLLILCKSFGAALYGILLIPAVRWTEPRFQMRFAVMLVSLALVYPAMRSMDLFPTQSLLQMVGTISGDRASSLKTRFDNEDKLLARWSERPIFGWGRYGRNRVYNEDSGTDEAITDGLWILTLGQYGLFGFIAQFGLLSISVFRASSALKLTNSKSDAIYIGAIGLILSANIVELIPNSGLLPWAWLLCGALAGRTETLHVEAMRRRKSATMDPIFAQNSA